MTSPRTTTSTDYTVSYFALRRTVGWFGILLPIVVFLVGLALPPHQFLSSISAYYYIPFAGSIFVGVLWAIGVFLWFYDYEHVDNILTSIAGTFAFGIATFPTPREGAPTGAHAIVGGIHFVCAAAFFVTLALISLRLFTRGPVSGRPRKKARNIVYIVCGVIMLVALLSAGITRLLLGGELFAQLHVLFYCEVAASWAFGASWLIKGQMLIRDLD